MGSRSQTRRNEACCSGVKRLGRVGESEGVAAEAANGEPVTADTLVAAGGPEEGPGLSCRVAWRLAERTSAVHGRLRGFRVARGSPPRQVGLLASKGRLDVPPLRASQTGELCQPESAR